MGAYDDLLAAALLLPPAARATLADQLLESLEDPQQEQIDAVWELEATRRAAQIEEGALEAIPGDGVMGGLRARLKP
jgi:putative addiction module component (TIGR02574 family)